MKKIIAIILCMLLAVAPMAMAEGCDLKISNMSANILGTEFALKDIELVLGVGGNDSGAGMHIGVNAGGSSVADIVLGINSEKLLAHAEGISDVYSVDLQTIFDLIGNLLEQFNVDMEQTTGGENILDVVKNSANQALQSLYSIAGNWIISAGTIAEALDGAVTADGDVEIDGEKAVQYKVFVSEEDAQIVLNEIGARLGELLNRFGQAKAAERIAEILNGGVRFSVDGAIAIGETRCKGEFVLNVRNEEADLNSALVLTVNGSEAEREGLNIANTHIEISAEDDGERNNLSAIDTAVYSVNEQFAGIEISSSVPDQDPVVVRLYLPAIQANGVTEFSIRQDAAQMELNIQFNDGMFKAALSAMDQYLNLAINRLSEKAVNITFDAYFGGQGFTVSLDAAIEANDAAWLKTDATNTVDIFTIDDAQLQKLQNEAMLKLMGLLGTVAGSSDALAGLIGQMM